MNLNYENFIVNLFLLINIQIILVILVTCNISVIVHCMCDNLRKLNNLDFSKELCT